MAKSSYLFKFLPIVAVFIYSHTGSINVSGNLQPPKHRVGGVAVLNPFHASSLFTDTLSVRRRVVRTIYNQQIGVKEIGINGGRQVEIYQHYVGLKKGDPWCAAFVCWTLGQARIANPKTGWAPGLFPSDRVIWKRKNMDMPFINKRQPQTGDVFGIWFPEKGRIAHAGFVDQWTANWVITAEGNTITKDGEGVFRKRRLTRSLYLVADYTD